MLVPDYLTAADVLFITTFLVAPLLAFAAAVLLDHLIHGPNR